MFFATPLIGAAALLSSFAVALPRPDSAIGDEVAVSAPNGSIISDTAAPATQTAAGSGWGYSSQAYSAASSVATSADSYSGSAYNGNAYSSQVDYSSQTWTTSAALATSTSSGSSYSSSYGSGSSSWSNQNYNSCVQQCMASYGGPSASDTPPSSASSYSGSGSAATHTIIVAPTQGVLRFVPFALNASVGDNLFFMWGANNHTVTKSSSLTPCNKTSDNPFTSGEQNIGFNFTHVVNDTNPLFFYCGTPTHCEKGMFGIINPPNALGSPTSAASMMPSLAANDSGVATYAAYTNSQTASNSMAAGWGASMDMASIPKWAHSYVAENIMYTRNFLAANSEVIMQDGSVNMDMLKGPAVLPKDISAALNSTGATSSASPVSTSSGSASSSGSSAKSSAIVSTSSSKVLVGLIVGLATFMML